MLVYLYLGMWTSAKGARALPATGEATKGARFGARMADEITERGDKARITILCRYPEIPGHA